MRTLNDMYFRMKVRGSKMIDVAKVMVSDFLHKENGEVNIVATVVLCGVAVMLAIVFREAIAGLIRDVVGAISGNAKNVVVQPVA